MKTYVKTALFYILSAVLLLIFTAFENFTTATFLYFRPSLLLCICMCFAKPVLSSVIIASLCGFLADFFSLSLPLFALLYLYISSGCVWSVRLFVSLSKKAVFFTCFFALLGFFLFESFPPTWNDFLKGMVFSLINASLSPIVYGILKRAKL